MERESIRVEKQVFFLHFLTLKLICYTTRVCKPVVSHSKTCFSVTQNYINYIKKKYINNVNTYLFSGGDFSLKIMPFPIDIPHSQVTESIFTITLNII